MHYFFLSVWVIIFISTK